MKSDHDEDPMLNAHLQLFASGPNNEDAVDLRGFFRAIARNQDLICFKKRSMKVESIAKARKPHPPKGVFQQRSVEKTHGILVDSSD